MTGEGRHPERVPMREAALSLTPPAIGGPVRELDPPVPVRAWIHRTRHGWKRLDARADGWTAVAVRVHYEDEHGRTDLVWVWANAVERIESV